MFKYSDFNSNIKRSNSYKVKVNGIDVPVYVSRSSKYPFNTIWPNHQRDINQSELNSYINLISDEKLNIEVEVLTDKKYNSIAIKPYSKKIEYKRCENIISFNIENNGFYILEIDGYHDFLYIFNSREHIKIDETVTYYFGPGIYDIGKLTLKSNDIVYLDKDAYVYGMIYSKGEKNIKIYGNGIFDGSKEIRPEEDCYSGITNGNVKFYDCENISISGIGFTDSAIWCINLFHSMNILIDDVKVFGEWRYNTDGIDIVNSKDVKIINSFVHSFDDTITLKGIKTYQDTDVENIYVDNCVVWCDWGRCLEIGLETECKKYNNIVFKNCDVLRGGSVACDIQNGGIAEINNIIYENINLEIEESYTESIYQDNDEMEYKPSNEVELSQLIAINNNQYRGRFNCAEISFKESKDFKDSSIASIKNIKFKNLSVYASENLINKYKEKCITIYARNFVPTATFENILIENIKLNEIKVQEEQINILIDESLKDIQIKL